MFSDLHGCDIAGLSGPKAGLFLWADQWICKGPGSGQMREETSQMGPSRRQIQASPLPAGLGEDFFGEEWEKACLFKKQSIHKHKDE